LIGYLGIVERSREEGREKQKSEGGERERERQKQR